MPFEVLQAASLLNAADDCRLLAILRFCEGGDVWGPRRGAEEGPEQEVRLGPVRRPRARWPLRVRVHKLPRFCLCVARC